MKKIIVVGAGPAGLTAAYELIKYTDYSVIVLEESDSNGGIARTVKYNGNYMDLGGHRLFSKVERVNEWWNEILPLQNKERTPNSDFSDEVMLFRNRFSHIFFNGKMIKYPISVNMDTLSSLGLKETILLGISYIKSMMNKREENNLEDFYINRFGLRLYKLFFEKYTEKLWGVNPSKMPCDWGRQRVKGVSVSSFLSRKKNQETSLIDGFYYPKYGVGQLWDVVAQKIQNQNGNIIYNAKVVGIQQNDSSVNQVKYILNGKEYTEECDFLISSMPLSDLIIALNDVPQEISEIASRLEFRNFITVGIQINKELLRQSLLFNESGGLIKDQWLYVNDNRVNLQRLQIYNNWSAYMLSDNDTYISLGLEYFCGDDDKIWTMNDTEIIKLAISELITVGFINDEKSVEQFHVERVSKAYPSYVGSYKHIRIVQDYLNQIANLYCVGRNGQHRYNNIDHSMCTSFLAVEKIVNRNPDKEDIWMVNTEEVYNEEEIRKD